MDKKLQEKKLYLENADKIVSRLSSETVDKSSIITLVKQIEPYHYEEVVEERFLSKLCGYSICGNELKNIPTQKYQISTKLNKVYDLSDRKRYCSADCYKASKYLEAQISTTPVWLRHTPEYLRNEGSIEIKLWSSISNKTQTKQKVCTNSTDITVSREVKNEELNVLSNEIENELKQIENEWNAKFKITEKIEEKQLVPLSVEKQEEKIQESVKEDLVDTLIERSETLKKKFIESMEIHKKPADFSILKHIFSFKISNESNKTDFKQLGEGSIIFEIDEISLKQLLFVEYIVQRINELLTSRTKAYLQEKESKENPTINEEREREEYIEACDKYVAKKNAFFSDIDFEDSRPKTNFSSKKYDEIDNGEKEMEDKLKEFEGLFNIESNVSEKNESTTVDSKQEKEEHDRIAEDLKPLPDYHKLKEEAIQQQLKIREFFMGPSSKKRK